MPALSMNSALRPAGTGQVRGVAAYALARFWANRGSHGVEREVHLSSQQRISSRCRKERAEVVAFIESTKADIAEVR